MTHAELDRRPYGLEVGTPELKSVGAIAFGPEGILFVADNAGARIVAVDLGDPLRGGSAIEVDDLDARLAAYLGCPRADVHIRDMAVRPSSGEVYLSVMRGTGSEAVPLIVNVGADGSFDELSLDSVLYSQATIEDAPSHEDDRTDIRVVAGPDEGEQIEIPGGGTLRISRDRLRSSTVTDLAYADGFLLVAGASNEEFSSTLRRIPFPFGGDALANSLEIFHVSHGKYETASPIRTFVPYGDASVLASYTCSPLVQFSLAGLQPGTQVRGKTVAELGARNTPLDMVSYRYGDEEYLLVSHTCHPLMKIACSDIDAQGPLTEPKEPVGVPRETLPHEGVAQMAAVEGAIQMLQRDTAGSLHLRSYDTATL
jgi:hypothetical protein